MLARDSESFQEYVTINIHHRLYCYTHLPFGEMVLKGLPIILEYLDILTS